MFKVMKSAVLLPMAFLALAACVPVFCSGEEPKGAGSIFPPANPPDFIKAQWDKIATQTWLPYDKWTWQKVGLPAGLEEQVWNSWGPGSKQVWRNVAPGYANVVYDAKVDKGVVTLILDGAGLVQSKDYGKTWRPLSHHLTAPAYGYFSFDISPANPDLIVVAGGYLDRSHDGGRSWSIVYDKSLPALGYDSRCSFGCVRFNADGSRLFSALGAFGHSLEPRSDIEPKMEKQIGRKLIYVADSNATNFKTIDLGSFSAVRCIVPHPKDPDMVLVSFADGSIYMSLDATAESPSFTKLELPANLASYQAISIDISPVNIDELLLVMLNTAQKPASKLVSAKIDGRKLECSVVPLKGQDGKPLIADWNKIASAKWNPRNPAQVFVGVQDFNAMIVSDDSLWSFRKIPFPKSLLHDEPGASSGFTFYSDPHKFCFDRSSDFAVAWSCIGIWSSSDQFKTIEDLLMTYDDSKKLYGNKGVGFAECGVSICMRKNFTYLATNDHGLFRSDGKDTSKWRRISLNPGMPVKANGEVRLRSVVSLGISGRCVTPSLSTPPCFERLAAPFLSWL